MTGLDMPTDGTRARQLDEAKVRRIELHDAAIAFEVDLATPCASGGWSDRVTQALSNLSQALDAHIATTEGPRGLLAEVDAAAPRLRAATTRLRREHVEMRVAIEHLIAHAKSDAEGLRDEGLAFLGQIARHRHRGADLVYEAYGVDLGSG